MLPCLMLAALASVYPGPILHVDDDAPGDPGPGDSGVSDPLEDGSAAHPFDAIQEAIDAAAGGATIIVEPGVYLETIDLPGTALTLRGAGGPSVTTIDAGGAGSVVTCTGGEGPDTVVQGFTITGGAAERGGGVSCDDGALVLDECVFVGNAAASSGAGAYFSGGTAALTGCTFTGNVAGTTSGSGRGAGLYSVECVTTMSGCAFLDNHAFASGGAIYVTNSMSGGATAVGCVFSGNSAILGGAVFDASPGRPGIVAVNCAFTGNAASGFGGGIYYGSDATVAGCTFAGNSAGLGGGIYVAVVAGSAAVTNTILWGNTPDQLIDSNLLADVTYSDVQGGWPGIGNIDADPQLADADGRLSAGSPCVDAGGNWGVPADVLDLDGDGDAHELTPWDLDDAPRFAGQPGPAPGCGAPVVVDMGAYERRGDEAQVIFADLDGDGVVGVADLAILAGCLGADGGDCCIADLDLDGAVGPDDHRALLMSMVSHQPAAISHQ